MPAANEERAPGRVLIAGGGIAGLETLLALHDLAGDRAEVTMVAPRPDFFYKPLVVEEPFTTEVAERRELAPIAEEMGATFVQQALDRIDPDAHVARLDDGSEVPYDLAVVCVGGINRPAFEGARTLEVSGDRAALADLLTEVHPESEERIAFVVPPRGAWPLPIYELALMTQGRARELGLLKLRLTIITPEPAPLIVFGTNASNAVAETLEVRHIEVRTATRAREDRPGVLELSPGGERIAFDQVIALPVLEGPRVEGLPCDEDGFMPIDDQARVKGVADVYAAGDGTNFPIKQGGIATEQADAAAEEIAARLGADIEPQPFHPVLRGMLLTGDESLKLRHSLTGGGGEGTASYDYLWWPPHKVSGRYLAPYLAGETAHLDLTPPIVPLDVEVALPHEWHAKPMTLDALHGTEPG
ncbi:MAG: FAD-dependent oxidoreductase [Solirubrobacterales bacterium]